MKSLSPSFVSLLGQILCSPSTLDLLLYTVSQFSQILFLLLLCLLVSAFQASELSP
ncbi:hypothetical protein DPMN_001484 [Dreissena polymorpha]|uniref:Uncharacterized protein n=1 Tax=Dreissena polymorpha TaxID=45954 RepID=A0A9D4MKE1_DREPO|nr:hypothetical protein DPMN_001484 [Dreissena polymorpha]